MGSLSLKSLYSVLITSDDELISNYSKMNGFCLKDREKEDYIKFIKKYSVECGVETKMLGFFVGQKTMNGIEQEFDLLRFSKNELVNIEIKNKIPSDCEKCCEQLRRHYRVLNLINSTKCYMYIVEEESLYVLEDDNVNKTDFSNLLGIMSDDYIDENLLYTIDMTRILVSPYSEVERFVRKDYVLTQNQDEIKRKIIEGKDNIIALEGQAGTGKSLLLMDIAMHYREQGKKVCVLLCRNYKNKNTLYEKLGIYVEEIKKVAKENVKRSIKNCDAIFVDEAQRIREEQLSFLMSIVKSSNDKLLFFSMDKFQTLNNQERSLSSYNRIINTLKEKKAETYKLSNNMRANKSIIMFCKRLINLNCENWNKAGCDFSCIRLTYFSDNDDCMKYLECSHNDKVVIELTEYKTKSTRVIKKRKLFSKSRDPHNVLGEEYDDVVLLLDEDVKYMDENGEEIISSSYSDYYPYDVNHCIYEAVTRARKTLEIVVLNNRDLYCKISGILTN